MPVEIKAGELTYKNIGEYAEVTALTDVRLLWGKKYVQWESHPDEFENSEAYTMRGTITEVTHKRGGITELVLTANPGGKKHPLENLLRGEFRLSSAGATVVLTGRMG